MVKTHISLFSYHKTDIYEVFFSSFYLTSDDLVVLPAYVDDGQTCPFGSPGLRSKASWTYYFSVPFDITFFWINFFQCCLSMMMVKVSSFFFPLQEG